ncbi:MULTISPECIES: helix-turn-helix domain-containing protein [Arsenophonus]|uniref:helix-turn-helix domain-containing protein n=1 Tax=Arsenophonus TaxID=637 RepID=UPI00050958EF|nr:MULTISPECIES: helix-turn-helix transcriptional regulator [Arsenophonus]MDR5609962.1 helix-turn-helix transcriptional regulator [Arsenophonus sp.]MDR5613634.1 helix-turn-helix transcriptional regulator [Arsenophonus sp.]
MSININVNIGKMIKFKRKEKGLSGELLAEKIGVSQQQLSRYERGVNDIKVNTLYSITQVLNIPIDSFFAELIEEQSKIKQKNSPADEFSLLAESVILE